jgi:putative lipoic acid-binding regulatory protein
MKSRYEHEAERLAKLPRAARYDELLRFPAELTFKAIGRAAGFREAVRRVLDEAGHAGTRLDERRSGAGTYVAITFTIDVASGAEIDELYTRLEVLPGLAFLF